MPSNANTIFQRRKLLAAGAALAGAASSAALAQSGLPFSGSAAQGQGGLPTAGKGPSTADIKPYEELANPVAEDARKVLTIFSFSCPYCRQHHNGIAGWAMGLPEKWLEHVWVPAVVDKDSMIAATAFFAAKQRVANSPPRVAARSLAEWMSRAYDLVQESKEMADPKRAVKAWTDLVGESINPALHKNSVMVAATRVARYKITNTPSMAMGGRYVINPEIVNGRQDMFLQLASGTASMVLSGLGYRGK